MPFDNAAEYLPPSVQILLGADRLLTGPEIWIKGMPEDGLGRFCLFGAVAQTAEKAGYNSDHVGYKNAWRVLDTLAKAKGYLRQSDFNDAPETTFSNIKALLQEAIELESAKVAA